MLVIDASIALAWALPDERDELAFEVLERVLREGGLVPAIWPLEIGNALLLALRRKRLSPTQAVEVQSLMSSLPLSLAPVTLEGALGPILVLASENRLTAYDAAYLELAVRSALPLATADDDLLRAAKKLGVAFEP